MKRNRRRIKLIRSGFYARTIGIMLIISSLGILYVWQNVQAVKIGYQIKHKERRIRELHKKMRSLELTVSRLKMPHSIKKNLADNNINLSMPKSWQIVKIHHTPLYFDDCFYVASNEITYDENQFGKTLIKIHDANSRESR